MPPQRQNIHPKQKMEVDAEPPNQVVKLRQKAEQIAQQRLKKREKGGGWASH
jgi:hypothetical protein